MKGVRGKLRGSFPRIKTHSRIGIPPWSQGWYL